MSFRELFANKFLDIHGTNLIKIRNGVFESIRNILIKIKELINKKTLISKEKT